MTVFFKRIRDTEIVWKMATSPYFLEPLGRFRKRILYSNIYHTDYAVPTNTGAFLHAHSRYPHHRIEHKISGRVKEHVILRANHPDNEEDKWNSLLEKGQKIIKFSFLTFKDEDYLMKQMEEIRCQKERPTPFEIYNNDLVMSTCLDALGWEKHFIDFRSEMGGLKIKCKTRRNVQAVSDHANFDLQPKSTMESRELVKALRIPLNYIFMFPTSHRMIGAFSRIRRSAILFRNGRPFVQASVDYFLEHVLSGENAVENC